VSVNSSCVADLSQSIDKQGIDASLIRFRVLCTNGGLTCSRPLRADFDAVQVGLGDSQAPAVSGVSVLDSGDTSGTLAVAFSAGDRGGRRLSPRGDRRRPADRDATARWT